MSQRDVDLDERVRELRDEFDHGFSLPLPPRSSAPLSIVRLVAGGKTVAIRLSDIESMHLDQRIERVPGAPSTLLGLATIRGRARPVHDLGLLLGRDRQGPPRVLCLARSGAAFACEEFRGLAHVPPDSVAVSSPSALAREAVADGDEFIPLLDFAHLVGQSLNRSQKPDEDGSPQ